MLEVQDQILVEHAEAESAEACMSATGPEWYSQSLEQHEAPVVVEVARVVLRDPLWKS